MPQHEYAGLCEGAESFQHLTDLVIHNMRFSRDLVLPHGLQSVMFQSVFFWGSVRLDMCRCATWALTEERGAGQRVYLFLACTRLNEF